MRRTLPLLVVLAVFAAPAHAAGDPSRDVLWAALKTCVLAKKLANRTFPCLDVDLGDKQRPGTAVLRAPGEPTHVVVMPTETAVGREASTSSAEAVAKAVPQCRACSRAKPRRLVSWACPI